MTSMGPEYDQYRPRTGSAQNQYEPSKDPAWAQCKKPSMDPLESHPVEVQHPAKVQHGPSIAQNRLSTGSKWEKYSPRIGPI